MSTMVVPAYIIDPHRAFPEVPEKKQSTGNPTRPVSSLTLLVSYLLSGTKLTGVMEDATPEELHREIVQSCNKLLLDVDRVFKWAESLLLPPTANFTPEEIERYVPDGIESLGFKLRPYQRDTAAWAAYRMGSILALGCGTGKSATSTAAAIGAARAGRCRPNRCHIYAPLNAIPQWEAYCKDLKAVFEDVSIISIDSAHKMRGLDREGGAVIFDELHKLKGDQARRGMACYDLRQCYEWGVGLTGTLLHTGAEGVLMMQDIALPGLSRFTDPWKFGEAFQCIIEKKIGKRVKHALGMPSEANLDRFTAYVSRGVKSLSFASPEVRDACNLPGQLTFDLSDWAMPEWARELQIKLSKQHEKNLVYWAPDWTSDKATTDFIGAWALATPEPDPDNPLPNFAKVMQGVCREGRLERVIVKEYKNGQPEYRWEYTPGKATDYSALHDLKDDEIAWGPKLTEVRRWLEKNKKQQLVVAGVSKFTVDLLIKLMQAGGWSYNVIRGGVNVDDRKAFINEFQAEKVRVMVLQQAAGAESITLTNASTSMLLDHNWSAAVYTQFLARTHRIGQKNECEHYDFEFGRMQEIVVRRLRRGEAFDARVRAELEAQFWNQPNG